jgi:hypothetical protein
VTERKAAGMRQDMHSIDPTSPPEENVGVRLPSKGSELPEGGRWPEPGPRARPARMGCVRPPRRCLVRRLGSMRCRANSRGRMTVRADVSTTRGELGCRRLFTRAWGCSFANRFGHGCTRMHTDKTGERKGAISARCTRPCRGPDDGIEGAAAVVAGLPTERRDGHPAPAPVVFQRQ